MRKLGIFGALLAVVAFSAFAVASASANVWLEGGVTLKATRAATTHSIEHGLTFHQEFLGITVEVLCSGLFIGTVGEVDKDTVTLVEDLTSLAVKDLVECASHNTTACSNAMSNAVLHPENLPWNTLLLPTTPIRDDFMTGGHGEPAWLLLCELGISKEVLCQKALGWANFIGNGPNGARFEYTKASTETTCSNGLKGWITGKGEVLGFFVA